MVKTVNYGAGIEDIPATSSLYVRGPLADDSPFSSLLWADIRRACSAQKVSDYQAMVFEWHIKGYSTADILTLCPTQPVRRGRMWVEIPNSTERIRYAIMDTKRRLARCKTLGLMTVVYEACGGWAGVRELFS